MLVWGAVAAAAAYVYQQRQSRNVVSASAQPAYTTPTVIPWEEVPPTPPYDMVARYVHAQRPGYVGVPYGEPMWNGQNWEQAE